ncbi:zinc-binding dehydrogenase [Nocardia fusca]|uniref:Zinc-binding dehydrogenase n=1 Tax=Nocardia fusca TaxID=941183 RepID=A0ABV3F0X8_9NOCA
MLGISDGETLLIHAAAGGVGAVAAQLAVARGARVIGTASDGNHAYLRTIGAEPVAYGDGLAERVRSIAPRGVDAVHLGGSNDVQALDEILELIDQGKRQVPIFRTYPLSEAAVALEVSRTGHVRGKIVLDVN